MKCCDAEGRELPLIDGELRFLLMGNPNVGKSVIFSKLTGMDVLTANYTGSTVSFTQGKITYDEQKAVLVDVPGTYSLEASSPAEQVAVDFMNKGAHGIICVLDATNLERSLHFAYQVLEYKIPTVFALNLLDVAERKGIEVDVKKLQETLGVPVIPTIATRNIGIKELKDTIWDYAFGQKVAETEIPETSDERWSEVARIIEKVQKVHNKKPSFLDRLGDASMQLFPGIPIALVVLSLAVAVVVGGGKALRGAVLLPLVNDVYAPWITGIVSKFVPEGVFLNILVGEFGMLIKGIEWPIALILPYVFFFYVALSFLEDSGYLPRLGVLMDGILRRVGIQGGSIVPFMMGYGCAVPAVLGSRTATTYKERIIIAGVVSLAVPCTAQTGAFIALLGDHSVLMLVLVYMVSFAAIFLGGLMLNRAMPGKIDSMLLEIPNLLLPSAPALLKKIWVRTKNFLIEAEIPMILAIGLAAIIVETGLLNIIGVYIQPLVVRWLGLPIEASLALVLGVIRRELGVLPLIELELSTLQMFVGSIVALFYLPCLSVFAVLVKEFKLKVAALISLSTIAIAFLVGGLINHGVQFIMALF
ncbi:ferrous iron transporter B [Desulfuribacillus alkaliarsenatis]|uniref:Ferrous iron transporter B n=1 Tax=Desulfuribacillus alkaliarsenatis TaxID=766136 RepID=A0A1E5G3V9_9FIRM|nr:ferrous iron transporter B [Desulfuribacillus alkaliarsenatis]OEF97764.1 ferrous iron transporter B [Desulfuribacillus alkaliarsenatis]